MNLGLSNLLMAQQPDAPDYSRNTPVSNAINNVQQTVDEKTTKFSDYVSNKVGSENRVRSENNAVPSTNSGSGFYKSDNLQNANGNGNYDFGHSQNNDIQQPLIASTQTAGQNNVQNDNIKIENDGVGNLIQAVKEFSVQNAQAIKNQNSNITTTAKNISQGQQENLTTVFQALKQLKDSGTKLEGQNPIAALLALQDIGNGQNVSAPLASTADGSNLVTNATTTVSPSDVLSQFKEAMSAFTVKLGDNEQPTANPNNTDTSSASASVTSSTADSSATTNDGADKLQQALQNVLNQMQNLSNDNGNQTITQGDITKVAADIITLAKNQAEAPDVVPTDVKSSQVASMIRDTRTKDEQNEYGKSATLQGKSDAKISNDLEIALKNDASKANENNQAAPTRQVNENALKTPQNNDGLKDAALSQNIKAQADNNMDAELDKASQAPSGNESNKQVAQNTNSLQPQNAPTHLPEKTAVDLFGQNQIQPNSLHGSSSIADGDFVNFTKHTNSSNNMGTLKGANSADVMAQIKFGLGGIGGKTESKISIQLHPKELGSVDVHMQVGKDGKTKVAIVAENTDTLNLLQKEAGSLKSLLQDALQTTPGNLSFTFHGQGDDQWRDSIKNAFNKSFGSDDTQDDGSINAIAAYGASMHSGGGLDIRV